MLVSLFLTLLLKYFVF